MLLAGPEEGTQGVAGIQGGCFGGGGVQHSVQHALRAPKGQHCLGGILQSHPAHLA